ncbi:hypothetical protein ACWEP4_35075 [Streptomyces sp. NPDC004227]
MGAMQLDEFEPGREASAVGPTTGQSASADAARESTSTGGWVPARRPA